MKTITLVVLGLCAIVAQASVMYEPITVDYHTEIGIPEAARIKAAEESAFSSRIVGGSPAGAGQFPYQAGLLITLTTGETSVCGASLLSNTRLVTAAHCWRSRDAQAVQFVVILGSTTLFSGGTRIATTNVQLHANYNIDTFINDVAIIVIPWVGYNNLIQPVSLPTGTWAGNNFVNSNVVASGFGITRDCRKDDSEDDNIFITARKAQELLGDADGLRGPRLCVTSSNLRPQTQAFPEMRREPFSNYSRGPTVLVRMYYFK